MEDYNQIIDNLFIGNKNSLQFSNYFSLIVNCTKDIPFPSTYRNEKIRISVNDDPLESENLLRDLDTTRALEKIHYRLERKQPVLVHCFAGMQRSCAVVACYLMKYYVVSPNRVITFIQERRPVAFFGECNFRRALQLFYNRVLHA